MIKENQKYKYKRGAAMMIVVFFFVFISLTILIGIVTPTIREYKILSDSLTSKKSYFLAESGVEDVFYRLKNNKQFDASEVLALEDSTTTTVITDISSSQKEIVSLGDTNSIQRKIKMKISTGVGISFSYGILTGQGGLVMDNNSEVVGNVYSNAIITGSGSVSETAMSANSAVLTSAQSNGIGVPAYNITFGNANGTQDFAQSFKIDSNDIINKVQLYIKKVSTPSNLTVRIVSNSNGSPSTATIASGTLSASLVSTNYGWVEVPFSTNPQLSAGATYWIVIDGATSSSKYYVIGANNNGYANGIGKIGQYGSTWNNTSPSGLDGFFNLYIGGRMGLIDGISVGGSAYSHNITNTEVDGTIYCKTGSGNNQNCDTSRDDPVQVPMPISEQNILDWKEAAQSGGTYSGNYNVSANTTLGPKKITGDLTMTSNSKTLTLGGTIWVQGNLVITNNSIVNLSPWYGDSEGVIIVDGTITINNNSTFMGSGTAGSYILALSTSNSSLAIDLANNAGAVVLYAANGTIEIANNGTAKALTGYYIHLQENATITYDSGITNANFISGPGGSWNVSNWREIQ